MDQIKAEIGNDIRHLNTNEHFKDIVVSLVTNWVGNKITNTSSTINDFIDTTIKREFGFDQKFFDQLKKVCNVWEQPIPHVIIAKGTKDGKPWFECDKEYCIKAIRVSKLFKDYPEPVEVDQFKIKDFSITKFENEVPFKDENFDDVENGEIQIDVFGKSIKPAKSVPHMKKGLESIVGKRNYIGKCSIPLSEAINKHGSACKWPIYADSINVGFLKLIIKFDKTKVMTLKERLNRLIVGKILDNIKQLRVSLQYLNSSLYESIEKNYVYSTH